MRASIRFCLLIASLLAVIQLNGQFYNGSQMDFGKNRVQYIPVDWEFYRYEKYDVFFYAGGKDLSHLAAKAANVYLKELEERFNYELENRIQLILFNRLSDLRQSNLGSMPDAENNPGGMTRHVGNKIMLSYEDGTVSFLKQLKIGIADAFVQEFLYGSDFRDRLRASTLMNIPVWFEKGLVRWLAEPWNAVSSSQVRDGLFSNRYFYLSRLENEDAILAGFSLWTYIARSYGEKIVPDVVEMTRLNRSVESGFNVALAQSMKGISQDWLNYLDKQFYSSEKILPKENRKPISGKYRNGYVYRQLKISPDEKYLAWVRNDHGRNSIWLKESNGSKAKRLFSQGKRLPGIADYSFPILAWHPNGELLVYSDEHKGRLRLSFYNIKTGETERKFLNNIGKVQSFSIAPDGQQFAMVASRDGKTDLYIFNNVSNSFKAITNDWWDEAGCVWMPGGKKILFSSNRTNDTLNTKDAMPLFPAISHDLFVYDTEGSQTVLRRLTSTPNVHESQPYPLENQRISWLSDQNGIQNRYQGRFDSTIAFIDTTIHYRYFMVSRPITNSSRSIIEHSVGYKGSSLEVKFENGKPAVFFSLVENGFAENEQLTTVARVDTEPTQEKSSSQTASKPEKTRLKKVFVFGEKNGVENLVVKPELTDTFKISRQRVYETSWYSDYLVTRVDRGFLNQVYQPYSANGFFNPPVNGLFRIGISDLFENYRLTGGIRLAGNLTGNEYLLAIQDLRKRVDKSLIFHRQGIQTAEVSGSRVMSHSLISKLSFPFSEVARISGSLSGRYNRTVYLSTDLANLNRENQQQFWVQAKGEYVFDNSFPAGLNMVMGSRMKFTVEYFLNPSEKDQSTTVIGGDIRRYERVGREMIVALRAAGGTSLGPAKLLYYLGGVDNWMTPRFDDAALPGPDANYMFQTLATNMRGFYQNVRNGNSFGVLNAEYRWNMLRYFSKYPLRSDFFNSLQIVSFVDAGTAFTGRSPYSDENTFNQTTIESGPIKVVLKNQEEPIVFGFGAGIRTRLLGYFVRADISWGINDGRRMPALFYLSLCNDF